VADACAPEDLPDERGCVRLLGALLLRWMKDSRHDPEELLLLAEWIEQPVERTVRLVRELATETRGRRPGGPGGQRKRIG